MDLLVEMFRRMAQDLIWLIRQQTFRTFTVQFSIFRRRLLGYFIVLAASVPSAAAAGELAPLVEAALAKAGEIKLQLEAAIWQAPSEQQEAMRFLIAHMPQQDLKSLKTDFLLKNVRLAHQAWDEAPWKDKIPKEMFLNNVLPYASINERRDDWRADFYERFKPIVKDATSMSHAAAILNQKIFAELKVKYSTQRKKADQSPLESIESGLASCSGLAVLLIDACRAVGVPARFVGTPLWSDGSGNHSWVEVWDDGWHFTGAAEPSGDKLDQAWFIGRASGAKRDDLRNAIYATSFQRTPQHFPMVWDAGNKTVFAVNVTDRYTALSEKLPEGQVRVMFRVLDRGGGQRVKGEVAIIDADNQAIFEGRSNDESFDANDHRTVLVTPGKQYKVIVRFSNYVWVVPIQPQKAGELFTFAHDLKANDRTSRAALDGFKKYLETAPSDRSPISKESFSGIPLTREDADAAEALLWESHAKQIRESRGEEMKARKLKDGDLEMPFEYKIFGEKPKNGRSLFLSLHGGGGAPKKVNDQQWQNQLQLYQPKEGVYLAPRGPTDTWNLWHQAHIDKFFDRLIENLVVLEDVDPNRVYVMGYSAGGDGVYQVAPRMADRFAAAAMMAGHPNESTPLGLRNLPFTLHVGGNDSAYNRNKVAAEWEQKLVELQKGDPDGYVHWAKIYEGKGHWLDREDAAAIPWMAKYERNVLPKRVVWRQDDVTHTRFYWLAVDEKNAKAGTEITASYDKQQIAVEATGVGQLTVRLNDRMLNLDEPVAITINGNESTTHKARRTIGALTKTLGERGDPKAVFSAEVVVEVAPAASE